jgi:hypothetical protein
VGGFAGDHFGLVVLKGNRGVPDVYWVVVVLGGVEGWRSGGVGAPCVQPT